jgi:ATP-dependent helicase/nuclease subunit B
LAAQGQAMQHWHDPRVDRQIEATPIRMPAPSASQLLPTRLSASACEALRACPYRFFALNMLRLREVDELEREIEKRDYGTWLHEVLLEFHSQRERPSALETEIEILMRMAATSQAAQDIADADFLPFAASFAVFAPRYIAWLHKRDREGAQWLRGETAVSLALEKIDGIELHGIIDRADEIMTSSGRAMELIDYKTGSSQTLKAKVKEPLEDTQLAFYAALMRPQTDLPLKASYLALDGSKGIDSIIHPNVETSAAVLVDGLVDDLRRLRAGAGLPALGEGSTCSYCAARGVCRRDHWSEDSPEGDMPAEARE